MRLCELGRPCELPWRAAGSNVSAGPQAREGDGESLHIHRGGDLAAADVVGDVVCERVAKVVGQVGQRSLAGRLGLQPPHTALSLSTCSLTRRCQVKINKQLALRPEHSLTQHDKM